MKHLKLINMNGPRLKDSANIRQFISDKGSKVMFVSDFLGKYSNRSSLVNSKIEQIDLHDDRLQIDDMNDDFDDYL